MNTCSQIPTLSILNLFLPVLATPLRPDENFYDEGQLADELPTWLPEGLVCPPPPEVDPDEFEKLYQWFLS
jgi:hypothetical protein